MFKKFLSIFLTNLLVFYQIAFYVPLAYAQEATPASGSITAPTNNSYHNTIPAFTASVNDNTEIASLKFQYKASSSDTFIDLNTDTSSPYEADWAEVILTTNTTYNLRIVITDNAGNSSTVNGVSFTYDTTVPDLPIVTSPSQATFVNANNFSIAGTTGADSLVKVKSGSTVVGSQQLDNLETAFNISVPLTQDSANNFTVTATDAAGNESTPTIVLTITEDSTDPIIVAYTLDNNRISPQVSVGVKDTASFDLKFSEQVRADFDILNSSGTKVRDVYNSASVTNPQTKTWDGKNNTGNYVAEGIYTIRIVITDPAGNTITDTSKTVTVNNAPLSLNPIGNKSVDESSQLSFTAQADDEEGGTLTFSLIGAPTGATINSSTGAFSWTPTQDQGPGSYTFTVSVSSTTGTSASEEIVVTVNEVNDPPSFDAIANQTIDEDSPLQYVSISNILPGPSDESDQTVTLSATSSNTAVIPNPSVSMLDPSTIRYTPVANANGTATITVTANDGQAQNNTFSRTFAITVTAVNDPPVITLASPNGNQIFAGGTTENITWSANDVDSNPLTITLEYTTDGSTFTTIATGETNDGTFSWIVPSIDSLTLKVRAKVSDGMAMANDSSDAGFTVDSTAPILGVVTAVSASTNATSPEFTFNSSEDGTVSYNGSCTSDNLSTAVLGKNTVALLNSDTDDTFDDGTYSDCTITITDAAGNPSNILKIPSFTVDTTGPSITIDPYNTDPTNADIIVNVSTNEGALDFISHTFSQNGDFDFVATDKAGNVTTKTVTITNIDKTAPTVVTRLGNDSTDVVLNAGSTKLIVFSEALPVSYQTAVQNALTAGTNKELSYSWDDSSFLTITAAEITTFANDVVVNVSDVAGNTAMGLLIVDSSLDATQIAPVTTENGNSVATIDSTKPQVVIINPTQAVNLTINSGTTNPTIDVSSFITGGTGTLPAITITSANANNTNIAIPASTVVTSADLTWNGVIAAPTVTAVTLPQTAGETKILSTAIEVGFTGAKLSFDKAVRLSLPGQAGKRAGYIRTGIDFTEITNTCTLDNQSTGDALAVDGECKIDAANGLDLVIWTKHFTQFATYTQTTNPVSSNNSNNNSSSSSSNGGGGGGGSSCGDPAPGSAPTLLSAVARGNNAVTLTWSKAAGPVSYYLITYGSAPGLQQYGNPNVGGPDTTSYPVSHLSGGTRYYFKVRAGNGCTPGSFSNEVSATPGGGFITTPAVGFAPGVLGAKTQVTPKVQGVQTPQPQPQTQPQPQPQPQVQQTSSGGSFFGAIISFFAHLFGR